MHNYMMYQFHYFQHDPMRSLPSFQYLDVHFRTAPELTFSECKRIAQVSCYFAEPLTSTLNLERQVSTHHRLYTTHRDQAIDEIERTIHKFSQLTRFFQKRAEYRLPFRIYMRKRSQRQPHFLIQSFARNGGEMFCQLNLLSMFFKACLSWHGGGLVGLKRLWPSSMAGLHTFIGTKGEEAHTLIAGDGGAQKLVVTPLHDRMHHPRDPDPPVVGGGFRYAVDPTGWECPWLDDFNEQFGQQDEEFPNEWD